MEIDPRAGRPVLWDSPESFVAQASDPFDDGYFWCSAGSGDCEQVALPADLLGTEPARPVPTYPG